jgi:hypothetical protein
MGNSPTKQSPAAVVYLSNTILLSTAQPVKDDYYFIVRNANVIKQNGMFYAKKDLLEFAGKYLGEDRDRTIGSYQAETKGKYFTKDDGTEVMAEINENSQYSDFFVKDPSKTGDVSKLTSGGRKKKNKNKTKRKVRRYKH